MSKKWCQYCRVNIDYSRDAIRKHQQSRLHQQNKERQINHQRRQAKKDHKDITSKYTLEFSKKQPNPNSKNPTTTTVPKLSEQQEKKEMLKRMKVEAMDEIKAKIHTFIAQKTEGKFGAIIEYPEEPMLTTAKYNDTPSNIPHQVPSKNPKDSNSDDNSNEESDSEDDFKMWRITLCSQTNKPCFINNITGAKLYQKPAGLILTQQQTNRWSQLLQQTQNLEESQQQVNIGEWEEVNIDEDIFVANAVHSSQSASDKDDQNSQDLQEDIQELRQQLLNSSTIGDKSRTMKKLILTGKQDTVSMNMFNSQRNKQQQKYESTRESLKDLKGFIPRKKVRGMTVLTGEEFE